MVVNRTGKSSGKGVKGAAPKFKPMKRALQPESDEVREARRQQATDGIRKREREALRGNVLWQRQELKEKNDGVQSRLDVAFEQLSADCEKIRSRMNACRHQRERQCIIDDLEDNQEKFNEMFRTYSLELQAIIHQNDAYYLQTIANKKTTGGKEAKVTEIESKTSQKSTSECTEIYKRMFGTSTDRKPSEEKQGVVEEIKTKTTGKACVEEQFKLAKKSIAECLEKMEKLKQTPQMLNNSSSGVTAASKDITWKVGFLQRSQKKCSISSTESRLNSEGAATVAIDQEIKSAPVEKSVVSNPVSSSTPVSSSKLPGPVSDQSKTQAMNTTVKRSEIKGGLLQSNSSAAALEKMNATLDELQTATQEQLSRLKGKQSSKKKKKKDRCVDDPLVAGFIKSTQQKKHQSQQKSSILPSDQSGVRAERFPQIVKTMPTTLRVKMGGPETLHERKSAPYFDDLTPQENHVLYKLIPHWRSDIDNTTDKLWFSGYVFEKFPQHVVFMWADPDNGGPPLEFDIPAISSLTDAHALLPLEEPTVFIHDPADVSSQHWLRFSVISKLWWDSESSFLLAVDSASTSCDSHDKESKSEFHRITIEESNSSHPESESKFQKIDIQETNSSHSEADDLTTSAKEMFQRIRESYERKASVGKDWKQEEELELQRLCDRLDSVLSQDTGRLKEAVKILTTLSIS